MRRRRSRFICATALALGRLLAWSAAGSTAAAEANHVYVGSVASREAWIAWGTTGGSGNTIGRDSKPLGAAVVEIGGKRHESKLNWMRVQGLEPDTQYPFKVLVKGQEFGGGSLRTLPEHATKLRFFVIGDYGTGTPPQYKIAKAMEEELARYDNSDNPVRFVITTGDNIYGTQFGLFTKESGDKDRHWETRFFAPYSEILKRVPFYPTLGNHDGNESESRGDLEVYLDNFFFPTGKPERWYAFSYADMAQFYGMDSSSGSLKGPRIRMWNEEGDQKKWLQTEMAKPAPPWRIAYWHHPPFTAGPRHEASYSWMKDAVDMLAKGGVDVVFNGHEHNFQIVKRFAETGGVQYIVSGSGGELRDEVIELKLEAANIVGTSPQHQFLSVEIDGDTMKVQPLGYEPIQVHDAKGQPVEMPLVVKRRQ
ncbi:MAG: metallophosphoesterase [Acidobacteriota bacterium]